MLFLKIAMRNLNRNLKRTLLTGLIIGIGLASLIFVDALILGMKQNLIDSVTSTFLGDAQVFRRGFDEDPRVEMVIEDYAEKLKKINNMPAIETYAPRLLSYATVSSTGEVQSVLLYGIDPAREPALSKLDEALVAGRYLKEGDELMLGSDLARRLEVSVGDRVVLTLSTAGSGELVQTLARVCGIFTFPAEEMNSATVFLPLQEAGQLLGLQGKVHKIVLKYKDARYASEHIAELRAAVADAEDTAQSWAELMPRMKNVLSLTDASLGVMIIIVFVVIIFGIINTLFMSLYERLFEFGVLRAVGTRPAGLRRLIVSEAFLLGVYSVIIGGVLSAGLLLLTSLVGIDYTGIEIAGATIQDKIYPQFAARQFWLHPLLILGFTTLVSLYPAVHASRMSIAKSLKRLL